MHSINHVIRQSPRHATIYAELEATRQAYHALVLSVSTEWQRPSSSPAWSVGHVLDHIALVVRAFPMDVLLLRRFGWIPRPPAWLFDRLNSVTVRLHARGASPQSVRASYDVGYQQTLGVLARIREDEWQKGAHYPGVDPFLSGFVTLERLFHYPAHHYLSHAADIRQVLG